ncbi:hypothetical protein [Pseudonocardia sp. HH130630-07]|uniref:hypothetical protein n=1 Tax=Pseudonocardia sp. HH130630-07 TaxID=1690815 RepID=UPI0008151B98|nr:hypothetical protein [Pseudonocardia sp. HH130630-07]ANY07614.1 hypothetical protein AFB00_16395 [Pseudonocardia sp. HH130630-07]
MIDPAEEDALVCFIEAHPDLLTVLLAEHRPDRSEGAPGVAYCRGCAGQIRATRWPCSLHSAAERARGRVALAARAAEELARLRAEAADEGCELVIDRRDTQSGPPRE